jgi:hypothetical protein
MERRDEIQKEVEAKKFSHFNRISERVFQHWLDSEQGLRTLAKTTKPGPDETRISLPEGLSRQNLYLSDPFVIPNSSVQELYFAYADSHLRGTPEGNQKAAIAISIVEYNDLVAALINWEAGKLKQLKDSKLKELVTPEHETPDPGVFVRSALLNFFESLYVKEDGELGVDSIEGSFLLWWKVRGGQQLFYILREQDEDRVIRFKALIMSWAKGYSTMRDEMTLKQNGIRDSWEAFKENIRLLISYLEDEDKFVGSCDRCREIEGKTSKS